MSNQGPAGNSESCNEQPYSQGMTIAGKYTLDRLIGSGASGSVWMAAHPAMGLSLAVKIVHAHEHPDGIRLLLTERLAREARAAARIRHPAIVRVFDLGMTCRGDPFIAMELLHGEPLRTRLHREGKLSAEAAVALLLPIAAGLDAAHARGVVHRDIKPDNIVIELDDSGRCHPKLLDFGVAKLAWLQPGAGRLTGDAIVGTPEYMAPEQALGLQGTDHRVDIWSLCLVLYELVAGTVPFPGHSFEEVLRPIVQDPPRPIAGLDPELWRILQRGLEKTPTDRFPSMHALGASLAAWLDARGVVEDISGVSLGQWFGDSVLKDARASRYPSPAPHRRMHLAYVASLLSGASIAWFLLLAGIGDARSLVRARNNSPQPASLAGAPLPDPPGSALGAAMDTQQRTGQATLELPIAIDELPVAALAPEPVRASSPASAQSNNKPKQDHRIATAPPPRAQGQGLLRPRGHHQQQVLPATLRNAAGAVTSGAALAPPASAEADGDPARTDPSDGDDEVKAPDESAPGSKTAACNPDDEEDHCSAAPPSAAAPAAPLPAEPAPPPPAVNDNPYR